MHHQNRTGLLGWEVAGAQCDECDALIGLVAEPASPAKAGAGCLSGPAGHDGKIYGITSLRITCNL